MAFYNGSGMGVIAGVADTGVASDYLDLIDKIKTAAVAESWTALLDGITTGSEQELYLRGPGTTPGVQPYFGIDSYRDVPGDYYNWILHCGTGFSASDPVGAQPGVNSARTNIGVSLWNNSIPYYLVINARRIHCVVNVSGVWQHFYGGFFLPYATPAQYPFPQYLGGHCSTLNTRYSSTVANFRSHVSAPIQQNSMFWDPYGTERVFNALAAGARLHPAQDPAFNYEGAAPPYITVPPAADWVDMRNPYDELDEFVLMPCIIYKPYRYKAGELDGVFKTAGFSNSSGDTTVINGKTYLMIQDGYRNGFADFFAMLLE